MVWAEFRICLMVTGVSVETRLPAAESPEEGRESPWSKPPPVTDEYSV